MIAQLRGSAGSRALVRSSLSALLVYSPQPLPAGNCCALLWPGVSSHSRYRGSIVATFLCRLSGGTNQATALTLQLAFRNCHATAEAALPSADRSTGRFLAGRMTLRRDRG